MMLLTLIAGLSSAAAYAFCDLLQQRVSRVVGVFRVICWVLPIGAVVVVVLALIVDGVPASGAAWQAVAYSAAAGALNLATWFVGVRALRVGDFSLVGPLASLAGFFVAVFAIVRGENLTTLTWLGISLAVVGTALAAVQGRARSAAGAGWAVLGSVLWACSVILYAKAGELSWLSQAAWSRAASLAFLLPVAGFVWGRARRAEQTPEHPRALGREGTAMCVAAGLLGVVGLCTMTLAILHGPLAIAGVTSAQYATVAVVLGLALSKERPRPHQVAGVICTLAAFSILGAVG